MSAERRDPPEGAAEPASPDLPWDGRALSILTAEHASLASARSLAYNEAFTRIGNYLSFLSISFVVLALIAQATTFGDPFLGIAAITLTFDVVIGLITFGRILGTTSDDLVGVMRTYRVPESGLRGVLYALSTSIGMMAIVVALLCGVLAGVLALLVDLDAELAFAMGAASTVVSFVVAGAAAGQNIVRDQASLEVRFPSVPTAPAPNGVPGHGSDPGSGSA